MNTHPIGTRLPSRSALASWRSFAALDLHTLAPYARTVILTTGALVILVAIPASTAPAIQLVVALGILMMVPSHLFAIDERASLNLLYSLLPLSRRSVVIGRYATILATITVSAALGSLAAYMLATIKGLPIEGIGTSICPLIAAMLVLQSIQTPLYFTFGYTKARIPNTALLFATAIGCFILQSFIAPDRSTEIPMSTLVVSAGALAIGGVCFAASLALSTRLYRHREF